jgi:predicted AAA+ superfamily ATPase
MLLGPRQCGKSTLFSSFYQSVPGGYNVNGGYNKAGAYGVHTKEISFDDLQLRQLVNRDPALFLEQFEPPLLLDEVQYVPNLFPELKRKIDQLKRKITFQNGTHSKIIPLYQLTGSNQILMDKSIQESLAGRASYYYLNTLTVHEILNALPDEKIKDIIFKGGWPELYTNNNLSATHYLNDYIRTFVEKDIVMSAGIQKLSEFHAVLGLLAARTAQLTDYSDVAKDSGVSSVTIKEWTSYLERADLVYLLKPLFTNLSKRITKKPKLYFLDTGLASRLQGWTDATPLFTSPQNGALFETLVLAELVKFIRNYRKDWQLFFWRTKDGEEIDFILKTARDDIYAFEAKLSSQGIPEKVNYPSEFKRHFAPKKPLIIVTASGHKLEISKECHILPISELHDFLISI